MESRPFGSSGQIRPDPAAVQLDLRPERRLIRPSGSRRHVDFVVRTPAADTARPRPALTLALVLDRSGSMAGEKLATAKRAALAVVDRLDERDQAAVVVFDDRVEVIQRATPMTPMARQRVRTALARVGDRGSTALHEGWLSGCESIAPDGATRDRGRLARCFLLTDGLANVGLTDPEEIARQAAGVWENTGICTSTFGIGADYDEGLLGPLAVAGGGQFHHLRRPEEIARTFVGELEGLFAVAVRGARLELAVAPRVRADVVSQYWAAPADDGARWSIGLGDLGAGEERHVVVRFGFPPGALDSSQTVRARLVWTVDGREMQSDWAEVRFHCATEASCDAEQQDRAVMHWVGLHHAERAEREALEHNRRGDFGAASRVLKSTASRIAQYAGEDRELQERGQALEALEPEVAAAPMAPMVSKERYAAAQRRSRSQSDKREPQS